ncbi:MAG: phosphatidylglycerophosphatase A [Firmicutes bacterium]|jgi:phosphatidylglycerophosphatase A|nr:phosphatidylglycerophosphatase A [Bacillota bacterium]
MKKDVMKEHVVQMLQERGVSLDDIAELSWQLQAPYNNELTKQECRESVERVLEKREILYPVLTGLVIDKLAEEGKLPEPLLSVICRDEGLYGVDELLGLGITNIYGSVGLTSFGYLDKMKNGILGKMNQTQKNGGRVTTFLDDIVAALAAAASARLAHRGKAKKEQVM